MSNEYIVCYTESWIDPDHVYTDMNDETIEAESIEEAIVKFKEKFVSSETRQYNIDSINIWKE